MTDQWDFVEEYINLTTKVSDAPVEYQGITALYLISTFAGRRWTFFSLPSTHIFRKDISGGKLLNLWIILMGKSRISRKTFGVIQNAEDIVMELAPRLKLTDNFTPQYLVTELASKSDGSGMSQETHATWINDECSIFFSLLSVGGYMMSTDAVLSRIYDGRNYSAGTQKRKREVIVKPYLTALLASTFSITQYFMNSQLEQGFLNRFIFVPGVSKNRRPERTTSLTDEELKTQERIMTFLTALRDRDVNTTITLQSSAKMAYDAYVKEIEDNIAKTEMRIKEGYYANLPNFMLRIACLFRLSRMNPDDIISLNSILQVEVKDIERSIKFTEKIWHWFEATLILRAKQMITREEQKMQIWMNKIVAICADKLNMEQSIEGGWVTSYTINKRIALQGRQLFSVLSKMVTAGVLEQMASEKVTEVWKKRGAKPNLYRRMT